jgi:heat shock protein HslJ
MDWFQFKFSKTGRFNESGKKYLAKVTILFPEAGKTIGHVLFINGRHLSLLALLAASTFIIAACLAEKPEKNMNVNPAVTQISSEPKTMDSAKPRADESLAGTAWRLVRIMSMDDSVYVPDDRSLYTLELNSDGSMRVLADCNRGNGSWKLESAGQLRFGKIAATRAMCPPGSLHDLYMAQFPWVRSYVIKEGRLFLATMADGSIIELEPIPPK